MLLLGKLRGMKSSRGEERNSESESFYQYKINIVMPDKCPWNRENKKLANHLCITVFV